MSGTHGTRNGRGRSGCVLRIINTAAQTITNANSVPMLVMSPTTATGRNAPISATTPMKSIFDFHGVSHFGWISENNAHKRPSRDIE